MAAERQIIIPDAFGEEAPAPLEMFRREFVHPENRDLIEDQLDRFRPLSRWERFKLWWEMRGLHHDLRKRGYNRLIAERVELSERYAEMRAEYLRIKDQPTGALSAADQLIKLYIRTPRWAAGVLLTMMIASQLTNPRRQIANLKARGREIIRRGRAVNERLADIADLHSRYEKIREHLDYDSEHHAELVRRERRDRVIRREMRQENRWIRDLLVDVWRTTKNPLCHYMAKDSKGNEYAVTPYFQKPRIITADSHWFRLATSERTWFGYRGLIPYAVNPDSLTDEVVINKMSVVTGRQVEVRYSPTGAVWFVVNRLNSPNGLPIKVMWRDFMPYYPKEIHHKIPWCVGVVGNRKLKWLNFEDDPHILIGGTSRSGKSNLMNAIIASVVSTQSPENLRIVLIDGKGGIEFVHWLELPHVFGKLAKNIDDVIELLESVEEIMNKRFELFASVKCKKISEYHKRVDDDHRLPTILVCIDELNRFIKQGEKTEQFHNKLMLLVSLGAAAGVQVMAATQLPLVEVIPGHIKANMIVRISGAMPTDSASMVILDRPDASRLPLIRGRMLLSLGQELIEFQAGYIPDEDIADTVRVAQTNHGLPKPLREVETKFAPPPIPSWNEEAVIDLALTAFKGHLSASRMAVMLGDEPGEWHLKKVIHRIIRQAGGDEVITGGGGRVPFKGETLKIAKRGKGYYVSRLDSSESSEGNTPPNGKADNHPIAVPIGSEET